MKPCSIPVRVCALLPLALFVGCGGGDGGSSGNAGKTKISAEFASASTTVAESFGTVQILVNLSDPADEDLEIPFTLGGTATGGNDYTASASPVQIAEGDTQGQIFIDITDDTDADGDETVVVTLGEFEGGEVGDQDEHVLMIIDNEAAPQPEIEDNDNAPEAVTNGPFGNMSIGTTARMTGHIYNEINLLDPEIDRVDAFLLDIPEEINATVTVTPLGNADLTIILGGPGGAALIPGNGIQNDNGPGESETYSINIPAGDNFFVGVFCIENDSDYEVEVSAAAPIAPLTSGDGPSHGPASLESPILRYWLEVNGLLPDQPAVVERRQGWIVEGDQVHGYTEEVVR